MWFFAAACPDRDLHGCLPVEAFQNGLNVFVSFIWGGWFAKKSNLGVLWRSRQTKALPISPRQKQHKSCLAKSAATTQAPKGRFDRVRFLKHAAGKCDSEQTLSSQNESKAALTPHQWQPQPLPQPRFPFHRDSFA